MSMGTVSPSQIPNFLTASSPQGLRRAMLLNNIKRGMFIKYFDVQFVNGKWIAWFYSDADNEGLKNIIAKG